MNVITKTAGGTIAVTAALLLAAPASASVDSATATANPEGGLTVTVDLPRSA